MKFVTLLLLAIFCLTGISTDIYAQDDRETRKFWKRKAKNYVRNPLSLKAEFENYQNQIRDLKDRNRNLVEQLNSGGMPTAAGPVDGPTGDAAVDSLRWVIIQLEGELQNLRNEHARLEAAYSTERQVSDMGLRTGLVYGVQIGAFVLYEMPNPPTNDNDFVAERADGMNKYVIGNFRSYGEAEGFRNELKRMGMSDAFIVPYIDGVRVTIQEANNYLARQGNDR